MRRAWISGCSCIDLLLCVQICLRKQRNVFIKVAVMLAKLNPYEIANVVDKNSGLYARYL